MRRLQALAASVLLIGACSSNNGSMSGGNGGAGGTASGSGGSGAGGSGAGGHATGNGGSGGATGTGGAAGGTGGAGTGGGGGGADAGAGAGGTHDAGAGGSGGVGGAVGTGGTGGVPAASTFSCNLVLGIDTTSEWYTGGFETYVDNTRWEIIFHHPGFVANWADPNDPDWSTAITSACTNNSTNPDRVIFNAFADQTLTTYMNVTDWVNGLTTVVQNIKAKYSRVKRIDLLTMTRAPNNVACMAGNNQTVIAPYVDDAIAMVAAANPGLVTASPKFFAPSCDVFTSGGPHFTDAGKPIIAQVYGNYYSQEP